MAGSVTHVDFKARKVRERAERTATGGWPVLVAKPLRPLESDDSIPSDNPETLETAV